MPDTENKNGEKPENTEAFLKTVRERYRLCIDSDRDNRNRAKEALAFRDLDQWDEKTRTERENDPEGARPCLVVDKLNQHVMQVVNDGRQNRPQIKVRPVDDKADPETAKIYDGIIRHIQYRSNADIAYDTAFEQAVDGGFGYWRILTEYSDPLSFNQEIRIKRLRNRFAVYLDPARQEPDGSDAKYGFILYKVLKPDFKKEFGTKGENAVDSFAHEGAEFTEWYGDDWVVYAEYFWKENKKRKIVLLDNGKIMLREEYEKSGLEQSGRTVQSERDTTITVIRWRKVTGVAILEDGMWVGNSVPIYEVIGNELDIEGRVKRSGMIRPAMDAQRVDNYATSAFIENVALAPRSGYVAAVGQTEDNAALWKSANRRNISILTYKPVSVDGVLVAAPRREPPPGISSGWLSVLEQAEHNIQASMGRYNATLGAPSNETSGRAIQARNREGDTGSFHYSDNLTRTLRRTGQDIVDIVPKVMDLKQIARIVGEDGEFGSAMIDPDLQDATGNPVAYMERPDGKGGIEKIYNLGVGQYDVTIVPGPSYTTRRLESADAMMEIARGNKEFMAQFGDIIFKSQDWPGAEKIAERFKKTLPPQLKDEEPSNLEKQKGQIQQAAQMLGQKEAELTAAAEQIQGKEQALAEQEQKAQDAMNKVQKEIENLNTLMASLESEQELFNLKKKLAEKELEMQSAMLENAKEVAFAEMKVIQANIDSKLKEINDAAEEAGENNEASEQSQQSVQQAVVDAMSQVSRLISAPRQTRLIFDEHGNPVGSESSMAE